MVVAEFKNDKFTSVYGLRQWDFGQELLIKGTGIQGKTVEVHFALERDNVALRILGTIENENITVCIPDILLQSGNSIYAYVYKSTDTEGKTTHEIFMHVSPRAKPEDYTEKEFKNALQQVLAIAQSVREEADAGKFNATDEQVKQVVDAYMEENPVAITVDKTLTQSGKAADAKVTGDKFLQYAIKNTVTGESPVAITDNAEEKLQDLKLFGKTEQVTTTGKNLLSNNPKDWNIGKGISWSGNKPDQINTTNTAESAFIYLNVKPSTKYSFANLKKSNIWVNRIIERNTDEAGVVNHNLYMNESYNKEKYTFTTSSETKSIIFQMKRTNIANAMTETDIEQNKVMFYEGENVPYEPYTGGKPSPSPDYPQEIKSIGKYNADTGKYDVDVQLRGANIFPNNVEYTKVYDGLTLEVKNGEIKATGECPWLFIDYATGERIGDDGYDASKNSELIKAFYKDNKPVLNNKRNSIRITSDAKNNILESNTSATISIGYINSNFVFTIAYTINSNGSTISYSDRTVNDDVYGFAILFHYSKGRNAEFKNINCGINGIKNEPYREPQVIKLSLDKQLRRIGKRKDEVTKNGVVRRVYEQNIKKEQVSMNEYNWETKIFRCYITNEKKLDSSENYILMSNISKKFNIYRGNNVIYWVISEEDIKSIGVTETDSREMAFEKIKTFVNNNNIVVQYPLEKPITEPLPEDFKQAIESLKTYYPTTVVTADGGEVDADIEVTYIADTKNYVDRKIKETVSAQMQNAENILSLMPESVQATMIEKDTNKILEREVTR